MMTTYKTNRPKIFHLISLFFLTSLFFSGSVEANWWQKGTDLLKSISPNQQQQSALTINEIGSGLKDALKLGTENVVEQLSNLDGFNNDPAIHIPLPQKLQTVKSLLEKAKMSGLTDDLELKLNRAAEEATPAVKKLFWQAISEMTFEDINTIYNGPQDAATQYFKNKMSASLAQEMRPIVEKSMLEVGTIRAYDTVIGNYKSLPFVPDIKADLTSHVIEKGLTGIFYYLAKEESAIRKDPAKQTTAILKKVFGQLK